PAQPPASGVVPGAAPDLERATRAAHEMLAAIGVDLEDPALAKTPERVAHTLAQLAVRGPEPTCTTMPAEGYDGPVVMREIPFTGLCEHHLLPFRGSATVAYVPADRMIGLSALARIVEHFASGLQLQERMTTQIADWIERELAPAGVGVAITAEHFCMLMRDAGGPAT